MSSPSLNSTGIKVKQKKNGLHADSVRPEACSRSTRHGDRRGSTSLVIVNRRNSHITHTIHSGHTHPIHITNKAIPTLLAVWPQQRGPIVDGRVMAAHSVHAIAMHLACDCHASPASLPSKCDVTAMQLPCDCHAIAMQLPCDCHVAAMRWPCDGHAMAMRWPCDGHATAMRLPCDCHAIAMRWLCDGYAMAMRWLCNH